MRVVVVGAGAWGTAVAIHAARRHAVWLHARDAGQADRMAGERVNARYLPGAALPGTLRVGASLASALDWLGGIDPADALLVVGTTVAGLRDTLGELRRDAAGRLDGVPLVWLCKGIETGSGSLPHEIAAQAWPEAGGAALSGPSFAQEVAAGLPVALTVAGRTEPPRAAAVRALHHDAARIYRSDDVVGVEVGGALKNVMAIAAGIADGLSLGHNARAALITRGLAEIARFGVARGARPETFMGLTGLGDLVLTCTGDLSRNRRVGLALAAGQPLEAVLAGLGHVAEGVPCTEELVRQAARLRVETPIAAAVGAVLAGRMRPREAVLALLAREPRDESDPRRAVA
jgi:glycerol-3-phosphate dehydrogenase (NAD(P)+)